MNLPTLPDDLLSETAKLAETIGNLVDDRQPVPEAYLDRWAERTGRRADPAEFEGIWRSQEPEEFAAWALLPKVAPAPPRPDDATIARVRELASDYDSFWGPGVFSADVYSQWLEAWEGEGRVLVTPPPPDAV